MGNFGFQTPPRVDSPHEHPNAPTHERLLNSEQLVSPWNFDLSPAFSTIPSVDPFEPSNASTPIRHTQKDSLDTTSEEMQHPSTTLPQSRSPSPTPLTLFTNPLYNISHPSTWPIVYLPYHTTPGFSTPTHISEMLCHVHYKGAGALALHDLLVAEMQAAQTEEEKVRIEFSAYLSWPHNCTSDGWRVYSGMTEGEEQVWMEDVRRYYTNVELGVDEDGWGEVQVVVEDWGEQREVEGVEEILERFGLGEEGGRDDGMVGEMRDGEQ
ncbi:hypothetical protein HBI91_010720 [Parastagonospora nodorum]|nr:hypothetical protein HBI91_010720 [Parastagonospora nodorum]